jgi:hypothetical protein
VIVPRAAVRVFPQPRYSSKVRILPLLPVFISSRVCFGCCCFAGNGKGFARLVPKFLPVQL